MEYQVTIEGISPLLVCAFSAEDAANATAGTRSAITPNKNGTPRDLAEKYLYWDQAGKKLVIPGPNVFACIIEAGRFHKVGKRQVTTNTTSLVPAAVILPDIEIDLEPQTWEVDARPVVIPSTRGRIMRYRPRFDTWALSFSLEIDTDMFSTDFVRLLVDDAGKKIGLGDFRPARKGPFGRFVVKCWKEA